MSDLDEFLIDKIQETIQPGLLFNALEEFHPSAIIYGLAVKYAVLYRYLSDVFLAAAVERVIFLGGKCKFFHGICVF